MNVRPTPYTAAAAGIFAAIAWPYLWARFGGSADAGGFELVMATIFVIALPAHAFVVGFTRSEKSATRALDTEMLTRIAAWLGAAAGIVALRSVWGV